MTLFLSDHKVMAKQQSSFIEHILIYLIQALCSSVLNCLFLTSGIELGWPTGSLWAKGGSPKDLALRQILLFGWV